MFPEELGPPPCFTSFGSGLLGPDWAGGALTTGTSVLPQPIDSVAANPKRVADAITGLILISASLLIKGR